MTAAPATMPAAIAHDGDRRGEVAQVDRALVVAGDDMAPAAVVLVLLGERPDGWDAAGSETRSPGENQIRPPASRMRKFSSQSWARTNSSL